MEAMGSHEKRASSRRLMFLGLLALALVATCPPGMAGTPDTTRTSVDDEPLPEGSWRFIVSGDSRNCGDVIMPAIAANSAQFGPTFYWHLGDLRAIYKIDEDMAAAATLTGPKLTCDIYERLAWFDFVEHQITPFGKLPFYVGIGNHEVIPPKDEDAFKRHFFDWLDAPALHGQRYLDRESPTPKTYFHWVQNGVDFIYLDNANGFFSEEQLTWIFRHLQTAKYSPSVKSIVVGMHEALPDSLANKHSMGDNTDEPRARPTGEAVYKALLALNTLKPVYILASHSHYYMPEIFDVAKVKGPTSAGAPPQNAPKPPEGWIVGTAGAVRYALPNPRPAGAKEGVYGYLLGTVDKNGIIKFEFKEVTQSDVPQSVKERYPAKFVPWCFTNNSQLVEKDNDPKCIQ